MEQDDVVRNSIDAEQVVSSLNAEEIPQNEEEIRDSKEMRDGSEPNR